MRLLCPFCQKAIVVADALAGVLTRCPECTGGFVAPDLRPAAENLPYHPTEADWEKQPAPFTMRQLLDTLKQATETERQEFSEWMMSLPYNARFSVRPAILTPIT